MGSQPVWPEACDGVVRSVDIRVMLSDFRSGQDTGIYTIPARRTGRCAANNGGGGQQITIFDGHQRPPSLASAALINSAADFPPPPASSAARTPRSASALE